MTVPGWIFSFKAHHCHMPGVFAGAVSRGDRRRPRDSGAAEAALRPHLLHWQLRCWEDHNGGRLAPPHPRHPGARWEEPLLHRQKL